MKFKRFLYFIICISILASFNICFAIPAQYAQPNTPASSTTPSVGSISNNGLDVTLGNKSLTIHPGKFLSLGGDVNTVQQPAVDAVKSYKNIGSWVYAIATITMVLMLIKQIYKIGKAGDNPTERKKAITGFFISGIAIAVLGGLGIFVSFFLNL